MRLKNHDFLKESARNIVMEFAPEELPLFDELAQEYFNNPTPPKITKGQVDDQLAFGIEEVMEVVTPASIAMVSAVLTYLVPNVLKVIQEEGTASLKEYIRKFFSKSGSNETTLSPEQLDELRKIAYQQARAFGIQHQKAKKMSYAIIGSIALTLDKKDK